jgi:hypothetical protein
VHLSDGSGVVIDVRQDGRIEPADAAKFEASAQACASVGWEYRRVGGLPPVRAANLRWLSGYRHPRCHNRLLAARLLEVFADRGPLLEGARQVGDPIVVLPVVFHMLWCRRLLAEVKALLGPGTAVRVASGSR